MEKLINVIYIGPLSFPLGFASTKRRRYMVDYMNEKNIKSHVLCTRYKKNNIFFNSSIGNYGLSTYFDISEYFNSKNILKYYRFGIKKIKEWFIPNYKNVLIFHTNLNIEDIPFFIYAKKMGYKILFDQVETSYKAKGTNVNFKRKIYVTLNDFISNYAYRHSNGMFVISEALYKQNKERYPNIPLCILPNSTPILFEKKKEKLKKPLQILYTGTFAPKDGVSFLVTSFLKLLELKVNCRLILTGAGRKEDMKVLTTLNGNPNVEYKGLVTDEELSLIMKESDVLTMTRTNSIFSNCGFPFKLSEYLSTGNIVIATNVSDVSNIIKHKENGFLIEAENEKDFIDAILYIVEHEEESIAIGLAGLETMKKKFSIDVVGKTFLDFINKVN